MSADTEAAAVVNSGSGAPKLYPPSHTTWARVAVRIEFYEDVEHAIGSGRAIDGVKSEMLVQTGPITGGVQGVDVEHLVQLAHEQAMAEAYRHWDQPR